MKTSILVLTILGSAILGGSIVYLVMTRSAPRPVTASAPASTPSNAPETTGSSPVPPAAPVPSVALNQAHEVSNAVTNSPADSATNAETTSAFRKTMDALLDPHLTAAQKHDLIQQLIKSGQLDQAISNLKQRALDNPNNPEIPTTLGEVQLNELRILHESGGDQNDIAILAMQADQSFNTALKIDPSNYEAQLVKAISQTFWPADPNRDPQVIQTLTSLIDRQETMPPDPGFAQTYVYLGNEYQKMGQPDKAQATWQLGLQKFPNDPTLRQKLNGQ